MSLNQHIKQMISAGNFAEAIINVQQQPAEVLENNGELIYLLAVAQRLDLQLEQAIASNLRLLEKMPEYGRGWQELGHCYVALGNEQAAAINFYNATLHNPALIAAWRYLTEYYHKTQNLRGEKLAKEKIDWFTSLPVQLQQANDLFYEGNIETADLLCRNFLMLNKHHPDGMLLLAQINIKTQAHSEAEFLLESCVTLHKNHFDAGLVYLKLLNKKSKHQKALEWCETFEVNYPDVKPLLMAKATALFGLSKIPEALQIYEQLLEMDPKQPYVWIFKGHALKTIGEFAPAVEAYRQSYKIKPDLGDAWWSLANTKTYQFSKEEIDTMSDIAQSQTTNAEDKINLDFALGKAHEHNKQYDLSFKHYQRGNQLKQNLLKYDISVIEQQVENLIESFPLELFQSLEGVGFDDIAPIFIVGLPRAGSTLLEQILASHSQIDGTKELPDIFNLVIRLQKDRTYPSKLKELYTEYYKRFGEQYIKNTAVYRSGAEFFIDKMPNNFMHIGLIKLILPNAKVIDARRNPMDCCFSGYKQLFGEGQEFSYSQEHIARYYKAYEKIMAHWQKVLPGFVLHIQHEDVIEDLEKQVHKMLDFCGLPFEQNCLEFYNTRRNIKTPSSEQVRQPVNRKGLHQWKPFEAHLKVLTEYFGD